MNIDRIKLFHFPGSRSARVRWALHETIGDDFEVETLKLLKGEQYSPEFLAINPNHAVPALEISLSDGSCLHWIESTALVEWLVEAHPEKGLAPAFDLPLARVDYLQMLHFAGSSMDMMLWQVRLHEHLLGAEEADDRTVQRYRDKLRLEVEPQLAGRLSRHDYICGDSFSAADIVMGHNVFWARAYKLCQDQVFKTYLQRLSSRPSYIKAFADLHS